MISYHPGSDRAPIGETFTRGFKIADTDDIERIAKGISRFAWSGIAWEHGYRSKKSFLFSDWCVLDFDDPELPLAQAINIFCDCRHVIGTTRSHQKPKLGIVCDRYRVVIPWARRITDCDEFEYNMRRLQDCYPIDPQCLDGARHFFACREIVSSAADGFAQDVHPAPAKTAFVMTPRRSLPGVVPPWTRAKLMGRIECGERNQTFFRVAKDLMRAGFSQSDALDAIHSHPTNKGASALDAQEIQTLVGSASKSLMKEARSGRRAEAGHKGEGQGLGGTAHQEGEKGAPSAY